MRKWTVIRTLVTSLLTSSSIIEKRSNASRLYSLGFFCVTPQVDALAEVVESGQVLAPMRIHALEHERALDAMNLLRVELGDLVPVMLARPFDNAPPQRLLLELGILL